MANGEYSANNRPMKELNRVLKTGTGREAGFHTEPPRKPLIVHRRSQI